MRKGSLLQKLGQLDQAKNEFSKGWKLMEMTTDWSSAMCISSFFEYAEFLLSPGNEEELQRLFTKYQYVNYYSELIPIVKVQLG